MIGKQEGTFLSEADGLEISALCIMPEEKTEYRAVVQLVHGMSEHKERYIPFMEYLAEKGYITVIHDHRGHGKSVKNPDDLGYMYGGGAEAMLQDIGTVNKEIHRHFPDLPVILFGHSMGSLAVRAFTAEHDDCIDMLIICGSPSENKARPLGKAIACVEGRILGAKYDNQILVGEVVNVAWRIHPGQNVTAEKHSECRHDYCDNYRDNSCISYIFFKSFFILGTKALGYRK